MPTDAKRSLYGRSNEESVLADEEPRCTKCNKLLAVFVTRPWFIRCVRCKTDNQQPNPSTQVVEQEK